MGAIDYLKQQGLTVQVEDNDRLRVWPAAKLTDDARHYIKENKPRLISELTRIKRLNWLASVAIELQREPGELLAEGFIDRNDLEEQLDADPKAVAALIRSDPRWIETE